MITHGRRSGGSDGGSPVPGGSDGGTGAAVRGAPWRGIAMVGSDTGVSTCVGHRADPDGVAGPGPTCAPPYRGWLSGVRRICRLRSARPDCNEVCTVELFNDFFEPSDRWQS